MKILMIHQNFPGQFKHLAPAMAQRGHRVVGLGVNPLSVAQPGVLHVRHSPRADLSVAGSSAELQSGLSELATKLNRAESACRAVQQLVGQGFKPDLVLAHPGWGEAYFLRSVLPKTPLLTYAEYFYGHPEGDTAWDPEFATVSAGVGPRTILKNQHLLQALHDADGCISPTQFQRSQHPEWAQTKIRVVHDGIDTQRFAPNPQARVSLKSAGLVFSPGDEVVTFVARQLEPYRGYHIFMRCLPELQRRCPKAHVVIVGGDGVSYGAPPPQGTTWKDRFRNEVADGVDWRRVHFVGHVEHTLLTQLMQVSAVHVYLTYPFVLSWSLLEAMSIGCLVVGSDTAPVREVIRHGENGLLTDFFDVSRLANTVADALMQRHELQGLRLSARAWVMDHVDLRRHCLPQQIDCLESMA